jgi:nitrite reductase/ring-hydroxylating ferredoxin subunit
VSQRRSSGLSYQALLDTDTHPVPKVLRLESPIVPGFTRVPVERYVSRDFHELEVQKVWKRAWQMACREEELPEVGDSIVYDVAGLSFLLLRSEPGRIQGFYNACLHRGRQLREVGGRVEEIRCAFHGWCWNLDGSLKQVTCAWDFPDVRAEDYRLPEGRTAREVAAAGRRESLRPALGEGADLLCDSELNDSFYYTLFPNFHPWGAYNLLTYRFRPYRSDHRRCVMECMYLAPFPGDERPPPVPIHWLDADQDWTNAPELGFLARVFNQDTFNLPRVQAGLEATAATHTSLGSYGESKLRHFHALLDTWLEKA